MKLDNLSEGAQKLIDDFFKGLEALNEPEIAVVMAATKVGPRYGEDDQAINVVFGGPPVNHRCYGDMVMSISHDINAEMNTVITSEKVTLTLDELLGTLSKVNPQ